MSFPRYERYKESRVEWLGEVPAGWSVVPIKSTFRVVGGSTPRSDQESGTAKLFGSRLQTLANFSHCMLLTLSGKSHRKAWLLAVLALSQQIASSFLRGRQ